MMFLKSNFLPLWRLTTARRKLFEFLGSDRYSHPEYGGLLSLLRKYLPDSGTFVEAGAVDGFFESNTYYLERFHCWRGILVEPVPEMYRRIKTNRPMATSFNCALVSKDFTGDSVEVSSQHALSSVVGNGALANSSSEAIKVRVPARTLSSILDEAKITEVTILSLDVEGYELQVLGGLDFSRHAPRFICLECLSNEAKSSAISKLEDRYELIEQLTYRDYLFRLKR